MYHQFSILNWNTCTCLLYIFASATFKLLPFSLSFFIVFNFFCKHFFILEDKYQDGNLLKFCLIDTHVIDRFRCIWQQHHYTVIRFLHISSSLYFFILCCQKLVFQLLCFAATIFCLLLFMALTRSIHVYLLVEIILQIEKRI